MVSQTWLMLLLVAVCATRIDSTTQSSNSINDNDNKIDDDDNLPMALNPKYNKMLPDPVVLPKKKPTTTTTAAPPISENISTTQKTTTQVKKETTKIPLAEDPRFNKMLPETNRLKEDSKESNEEDTNDDYYDNYDFDDYVYDDAENNKTTTTASTSSTEKPKSEEKLKPIKGEDKAIPSSSEKPEEKVKETEDEEDDDDDEDDDEYDDTADEEETVFSENVPCPRDCICARNINSYLVATCSRLDVDVQKFGLDITDIVVVDVSPKYPILLGPEFFLKVGLKHVSSIKISNCTIENIHPTAFHGLDELFAVNLTNVGLTMINPDTFAQNKKLRLLTISGNDLSVMTSKGSPSSHYLIKSSSIEELDLSNNNLQNLLPTAFNQLTNIVYINLAQNSLKNLSENLFDAVETIEELDLSFNSIVSLPPKIFKRTALAILHLNYNDIKGDLRFGTSGLQQLDLSFCSIKQINNHMFNQMDGLTNLNLKGNGLTKIQPDSFTALRNLRHIDLSINDLDQVSSLMFKKNSELDVIRLNDNPRLSQLPTDGFQSDTGEFNVYLLDISNCAIGALGHKTFSTMPQMTTLKLAWNNINNLDKNTFADLKKLNELDLSNNLIVKLDEFTFIRNPDLTKLSLAGNPIKKLSTILFLPLSKLRELDVSECELHTLLADISYYNANADFKFFETLRSFNASFNQIKKISKQDVQSFKNLKTLDITNNPLKCNEDLRGMMKYLTKKGIVPGKVAMNAQMDESFDTVAAKMQGWNDLERSVCKRDAETFKPKDKFNDVKKEILTDKETTKPPKTEEKVLKDKSKEDIEEDTSVGEEENDANEEEENDSDDDYNEDDYDDEVDLNENEPAVKDKGLFADEVNIIKETEDKFLRGKLGNDDDDDDDDDYGSEEIIIERGRIYYSSYRFLVPILVVILSVIVLLLVIGKLISLTLRKRGERYRMALLASKNSIVYQKLSEDIAEQKTPKAHRYAPINQV